MNDFETVRRVLPKPVTTMGYETESPSLAALDRIEAEVERLQSERRSALHEEERLRVIETAAREAVASWDADGVIFSSQVDSIRAVLAKDRVESDVDYALDDPYGRAALAKEEA